MSSNGMSCRLNIDELTIQCQPTISNEGNSAEIYLSGELRNHFIQDANKSSSTASVYIQLFENTHSIPISSDWPDDCVGNTYLYNNDNKYHAVVNLILSWNMLDSFVSMKNDIIFIEPLFYREKDSNKIFTEETESDGILSYLKYVNIYPYIEQ